MNDRGQGGALILGGRLFGSPLVNGALLENDTQMDIDAATLIGIVAVGDTFTLAGEAGSPTHTVTGGPFYVTSSSAIASITFSTAIAAGGVADNAAVTFADNRLGEVKGWTIDNAGLDMIDDTVKGDTHRTFRGGLGSFTGSAAAWLDYLDAKHAALIDEIASGSPDGTIASLILEVAPARFFYGGVVLRHFTSASPENGVVPVGFTFQGTGQVLLSWGGAYDSCNAANGTAFGTDKPNAPPGRIPDLGFGGWIVDRANSGIDQGYEIQSNKAEQVNGHGGGQGGKYCTNDVAADNFTYFADIVPNDSTTGMGLGFRYEENPASGDFPPNYWEQNADGFELKMSGTGADVNLRITRRVAGTASNFAANVNDSPIAIPFRLGVDVHGTTCDVWREPIGGGARTVIKNGVDLTESAGGSTADFNDVDHQRFGLVSASADNLSTFDNITVTLN